MRTLFIGDIVGSPGRLIVQERLTDLVENKQIDLVIANGENSASGFGITPKIAEELLGLGIEVLTGGNHSWDRKEILEYIPHQPRLLRPANFAAVNPGGGLFVGGTKKGVKYAVLNLQGRVFLAANDDPFRKADEELAKLPADVAFVLVDMHAETTSEKIALGWYLDGRVTAVLGTHTHIPTADERILPHGTAFQTDVGMSGPYDSVIGVETEMVLKRFLTGMPGKFEAAKGNPKLCATLIDCDGSTGRARAVQRIMLGE